MHTQRAFSTKNFIVMTGKHHIFLRFTAIWFYYIPLFELQILIANEGWIFNIVLSFHNRRGRICPCIWPPKIEKTGFYNFWLRILELNDSKNEKIHVYEKNINQQRNISCSMYTNSNVSCVYADSKLSSIQHCVHSSSIVQYSNTVAGRTAHMHILLWNCSSWLIRLLK